MTGRRISVDLRLRSEGDYDVRLVARYRKKSGDVRVVRTTRKLSVTCRWRGPAGAPGWLEPPPPMSSDALVRRYC